MPLIILVGSFKKRAILVCVSTMTMFFVLFPHAFEPVPIHVVVSTLAVSLIIQVRSYEDIALIFGEKPPLPILLAIHEGAFVNAAISLCIFTLSMLHSFFVRSLVNGTICISILSLSMALSFQVGSFIDFPICILALSKATLLSRMVAAFVHVYVRNSKPDT